MQAWLPTPVSASTEWAINAARRMDTIEETPEEPKKSCLESSGLETGRVSCFGAGTGAGGGGVAKVWNKPELKANAFLASSRRAAEKERENTGNEIRNF